MSLADALDPSAIVSAIPSLLPPDDKKIETPQEGIAVLFHAVMTILGFRLVGLDDASSDEQHEKNVLPVTKWKKGAPDSFTFRYKHDQSSLVFLLKIIKLGKRAVVHGIALEDDRTTTLDVPLADFTSTSSFPFDVASSDASPLVHAYISSARIKDLVIQYKLQILQRLVPGLRKEGYEEEDKKDHTVEDRPDSSAQPPIRTPAISPIPNPEASSQPFHLPYPNSGPGNPLEIGRSDLEPLGMANPFAPPPLFRPGGIGGGNGGMHPGPGFFNDRMNPLRETGPRWGGDGFLPPMGAPPGARFDPVGPFGAGTPGRQGGFPGSGNRLGRGPGGGPDNDEFMPPSFNNDFYS